MSKDKNQVEFDFGKWRAVKNHWSHDVYHVEWSTNCYSPSRNLKEQYNIPVYCTKDEATRIANQMNKNEVKCDEHDYEEYYLD